MKLNKNYKKLQLTKWKKLLKKKFKKKFRKLNIKFKKKLNSYLLLSDFEKQIYNNSNFI